MDKKEFGVKDYTIKNFGNSYRNGINFDMEMIEENMFRFMENIVKLSDEGKINAIKQIIKHIITVGGYEYTNHIDKCLKKDDEILMIIFLFLENRQIINCDISNSKDNCVLEVHVNYNNFKPEFISHLGYILNRHLIKNNETRFLYDLIDILHLGIERIKREVKNENE